MSVVCKLRVIGKTDSFDSQGEVVHSHVALSAVYEPDPAKRATENAIFGSATPSANLSMAIFNKEAAAQFEHGKEYYVTFEKAV